MSRQAWTIGALLAAQLLSSGSFSQHPLEVVIRNDKEQWTISPMLNGMHQVYSYAPDRLYEDGQIAAWARNSNISCSRFPGGTIVKSWDWENPTGLSFGKGVRSDSHPWDTDWDPANQVPEEQWMSLDEHLDFIEAAGMNTPILGVNMVTGVKHNREEDAIAKAVRMAEQVKRRGYTGAWYYLGNEEIHLHLKGGTWNEKIAAYAQRFARYSNALKQVDPTIKTFWNHNEVSPKALKLFLAHDGGSSDGIERHGKYPYYSKNKKDPQVSFADWQVQFPLRCIRPSREYVWRDVATGLREAAREAGRPNYLVVDFEWGWHGSTSSGFNDYTRGLVMTELAMELIIGNYDASCYWDSQLGFGMFDRDGKPRSHALGMGLLGECLGAKYVPVTTAMKQVHGFAARTDESLILYLINKQEVPVEIKPRFAGRSPRFIEATALVNAGDDTWGKLRTITPAGGVAKLPPLSLTKLVFKR